MDTFFSTRFLEDVEKLCKAIDAPYSQPATLAVITAFGAEFDSGAVLWRTTSRPGDALNYRFYERHPVDVLRKATEAGLLKPDHPLAALLQAWSLPWGDDQSIIPEQSCDFCAEQGLAKAWAYMGGIRPLSSVLAMPNVPESVTKHAGTFRTLGLDTVRHVAVDFGAGTVNLYFRATGLLTRDQALSYLELVETKPALSQEEVDTMQRLISPEGFAFSVTIQVATGDIKRVAFYALGIPVAATPDVGPRSARFFAEAPSYDDEEFRAVAWSFGKGGDRYVKAEKSYCGKLVPLLRDWKTKMTFEDTTSSVAT